MLLLFLIKILSPIRALVSTRPTQSVKCKPDHNSDRLDLRKIRNISDPADGLVLPVETSLVTVTEQLIGFRNGDAS